MGNDEKPAMRPLGFLITECKIYTGKWRNDESPQGGPRKYLITGCKIYTEKWGNDENSTLSEIRKNMINFIK